MSDRIGTDTMDQAFDEAQLALLKAIKKNADANVAGRARDFAEAYALLLGHLKGVTHTDVTVPR